MINTQNHKKGQIHISETIAVLFIFFILVVFGILFYYKYQQSAIMEERQQLLADRAIKTTLKVISLPELLCTKGNAEPLENCIDMMKLRELNETFYNHLTDYYFSVFSYAKIKVVQLYPLPGESWVLYDKKKPLNESQDYENTFFVVTLRDEANGVDNTQYGFGYVEVGVYS